MNHSASCVLLRLAVVISAASRDRAANDLITCNHFEQTFAVSKRHAKLLELSLGQLASNVRVDFAFLKPGL